MRARPARSILWVALLSVFMASVTKARYLGNCSALKGIELRRCLATTRQNETTNEVVLDIGTFLMSLTTYSQTSRDISTTTEAGVLLTREHELAAARQHLREVYEDAFQIPVISVDLEFVDGDITALSKSHHIHHSTFFGNTTFLDEAAHSVPTLAQLESETLKAFSGASKEAFIKKYHFFATGAPSYFGVKYRYDVSVRNLNKSEGSNAAAATQETQGRNERSGTFIGLMLMFAVVLFGTLVFGLVFLIRKRQLDRVPSAQTMHDDCMVEEVDVIGSVVGSDVSLSPLQLLEEEDFHSSSENISHLGIELSNCDTDDDEEL